MRARCSQHLLPDHVVMMINRTHPAAIERITASGKIGIPLPAKPRRVHCRSIAAKCPRSHDRLLISILCDSAPKLPSSERETAKQKLFSKTNDLAKRHTILADQPRCATEILVYGREHGLEPGYISETSFPASSAPNADYTCRNLYKTRCRAL